MATRSASAGATDLSQTLGELNTAADKDPAIARIADGTMAYLSGGTLDRERAETLARLTALVADFSRAILPTSPELFGTLAAGGVEVPFRGPENTLVADFPGVCVRGTFQERGPVTYLQIWDRDLEYHDPVGRCAFTLQEAIQGAAVGLPCGYGRALFAPQFHFSRAQIDLVVLPPAE